MKTATAPAPPAAKPGIKKVNFGAIATATTKKPGTEYPVLPDDDHGTVAALVTKIAAATDELDALEGALAIDKAELRSLATPFYFERNHDLHEVPSSVEARNADGKNVLVAFQNRYAQCADDAPVIAVLGDERAARYFRQSFELKIAGDAIPDAEVEPLLAEMQELFARHNAGAALTAKAIIKPTADFHIARHSVLTVEENMALEKIVPIVVQIKTKGRKAA